MGPGRPITGDSIESLVRRLDVENVERAVETIKAFNDVCDPGEYDPEVEGISCTPSTASEHLRKAEGKLVPSALDRYSR